ncbi:MAG TPA: hypothetical protein VGI72_05245 [Gaiellales bacterium]|jgi:hypothetical protein
MPHISDFGGNVKTEYGHILRTVYPNTGFVPQFAFENFRRTLSGNPCPAS